MRILKIIKFITTITFISLTLSQISEASEAILKELAKEARTADIKFVQFSASTGEKLFRTERIHSNGEKISCMTCHTADPKKEGLTRANKVIKPMAASINPNRFTDMEKVQKWFKRNCNDVQERICTPQEKGDFVKYMMSIK